MLTILVVEDSASMRILYEHLIRDAGHTYCAAWTALGAVRLLESEPIDLAIVDLELGGLMSGIDVIRHVPARIPIVVVTGHQNVYEDERDDNPEHPLYRVAVALFKPVSPSRIVDVIARFAREKLERA